MNNKGFWAKIEKPFFCLAPMSDVTDIAFRHMLAKYSKDRENVNKIVFWTEFVSADGLCNKLGKKKLSYLLKYNKGEKPIIAQVFGANPLNMKKACQYIASLDFDGIDINMGCPDRSVIDQGAGSALINNPKLAKEIINAAREGIKTAGKNIPVSVKTRIGFNPHLSKDRVGANKVDYLLDKKWIKSLLKENISALTIHLRTKKEMSLVPAHWELMPKIIRMRDEISKDTLIIGNGDVLSMEDAKEKVEKYGCDGIMIGRGVFGNPWFFKEILKTSDIKNTQMSDVRENYIPSLTDKLTVLIEHTKLFEKKLLLPKHKNFAVMKKHFKAYVNGFIGAKELRNKLMIEGNNAKDVERIINSFLKSL